MAYGVPLYPITAKYYREDEPPDPPTPRVVNYFPFDHTVLLDDGRRMTAEQWEDICTQRQYAVGGSGCGGRVFMHANTSLSSFNSYSSCYDGYSSANYYAPGTIMRGFPVERLKNGKELKEEEKKRKIEERLREERLAQRTLADLDDTDKETFMRIIHKTYKQYKHEQEVKKIMSGLKWFIILLGLAIFLNFNHILKIIEMLVK